MLNPFDPSLQSTQDGLVGHFCFSIGLKMADRCEAMLNSKLVIEFSKPNVVELAPIVSDEHEQNLEPNNNIFLDELLYLDLGDHS